MSAQPEQMRGPSRPYRDTSGRVAVTFGADHATVRLADIHETVTLERCSEFGAWWGPALDSIFVVKAPSPASIAVVQLPDCSDESPAKWVCS